MANDEIIADEKADLHLAQEDLERLVQGIERKYIIELVKHFRPLQQGPFRGYRPDHLPWEQVPAKLARSISNNTITADRLLGLWRKSNEALLRQVQSDVFEETVEDDVARLLAKTGTDAINKSRVLWALLLDDRESIQKVFSQRFRESLLQTSPSTLFLEKVDRFKLEAELEEAKQALSQLRAERDKLRKENGEIAVLRANILNLEKTLQMEDNLSQNKLSQLQAALSQKDQEKEELERERDALKHECTESRLSLESQVQRSSELEKSLGDLKSSLKLLSETQQESSSTLNKQLANTIQQLEEERKNAAKLRTKNEESKIALKAKEDILCLAEERNHEAHQAHIQLEKNFENVKVDLLRVSEQLNDQEKLTRKLTQEKISLQQRLQRLEKEFDEARQMAEGDGLNFASPNIDLDERWRKAIDLLSQQVSLALPEQKSAGQSISLEEKWNDWKRWQQVEAEFVQPILLHSREPQSQDLTDLEIAQGLLALRWYLLEWLKLAAVEYFRANNYALTRAMGDVQ